MPSLSKASFQPGTRIRARGEEWTIASRPGNSAILCLGLSGIVRGKRANFLPELEPDIEIIDPADVKLIPDESPGFADTKLHIEAAARQLPPPDTEPLLLGQAAIDDLSFQHVPVVKALSQSRMRLLIADDVGLGKTLEAGMVAAEQILRGRADRILVISTRAMLNQFQKEFWTRFSIPLARLDSAAIRRMKNALPAHYNVFDQFQRVIVSIDTLKRDLQYRQALEDTRWDLVIIDEAHNAADRNSKGTSSLRSRLASLLSRKADALLLLTATPHDGSHESFSSLIRMLDPARLPPGADLERAEIEDLVVRRFRTTPEVSDALGKLVKKRKLEKHPFAVNAVEEAAYQAIADLQFGNHGKGNALSQVTTAKAIFSSPAACRDTVETLIRSNSSAPETLSSLHVLRDALQPLLNPRNFSKYQELLRLIRSWGWTGKKPRDRIVLFSERIATLNWLRTHLAQDLGLADDAIGQISGGGVEADERSQQVLEAFAQEKRPIRILLASDMASEGLNLHFHCHRLIHFDLPWSLLRFQQRNGRIDRYGQEHHPQIHYFVGETQQPKIRDMWVLDKLIEKDTAAQRGLSDPAVFLAQGSAEKEEDAVTKMVANGMTSDDLGKLMDANAKEAALSFDDLLFGTFETAPEQSQASDTEKPLRIFKNTFDFAAETLRRMQSDDAGPAGLRIDKSTRTIAFPLPDDMKSSSDFGYSRKDEVDERYMPPEAVHKGQIELSADRKVIDTAIARARFEETAWPQTQYLWDVHPIVGWLIDHAKARFGRRTVPVCRIDGMPSKQVSILMQGSVTDRVGRVVAGLWRVIHLVPDTGFSLGDDSGWRIDGVEDASIFVARIGLTDEMINAGDADAERTNTAIPRAVRHFQEIVHDRAEEIAAERAMYRGEEEARLRRHKARFETAAQLRFEQLMTDRQREAERQRHDDEKEISRLFSDWQSWIDNHCEIVRERAPHVDVVAVFQG